jgi:hypothetical protein
MFIAECFEVVSADKNNIIAANLYDTFVLVKVKFTLNRTALMNRIF